MWESRVLRRAFERLELHEGKLSRAVLRGGGGGDVTSLPDTWVGNHPGLPGPRLPPRLPEATRVKVCFSFLSSPGGHFSLSTPSSSRSRSTPCRAWNDLPIDALRAASGWTRSQHGIAPGRRPIPSASRRSTAGPDRPPRRGPRPQTVSPAAEGLPRHAGVAQHRVVHRAPVQPGSGPARARSRTPNLPPSGP